MKTHAILSGAVVAAALCAVNASAQLNYQNGDMLVAFGNGGSQDVVVDLGAISNFQGYNNATYSWDLSSVLTSTFGSVSSGVYWSVFGVNDQSISYNANVSQGSPNTVWATLARSNPANQTTAPFNHGNATAFGLPVGQIETIAYLTSPSVAPGQIVNSSTLNTVLVNTSLGGFSPLMTSPYSGNLGGDWAYNMLNNGAGTSDLYQNNPSSRANYLGDFTLNSNGQLSYNAVPEPSTLAMVGSGLLALIALRRRNK